MTPKDIFGVILRAAGLFILRLAFWLFYDYTMWSRTPGYPTKPLDPTVYLVWGTIYLAIGLYLLAGAPHILRFSYPDPKPEEPESEAEHSEDVKV